MSARDRGLAWRDFVLWAWGDADMCAAFTEATGISLAAAPDVLSLLIDEATGAGEARQLEFVKWVTMDYWGLEMVPDDFLRLLEVNGPDRRRTR